MNWDVAAQIATSLGALLAAASLLGGFLLYRLNQRDEMAAQFRQTIAITRPNVEQLKDMVSFELARELASTVVYSRDLELPLEDLYEFCHPKTGQEPDKEEIVAYLTKYFPVITIPLNTPLVRQYQALTTSVAADIALYQASFPGIYRVVSSIGMLLENILVSEKAITRDEGLWESILPTLIKDDDRISSLVHMKWMMSEILTAGVMQHMQESRKQIALMTEMVDLVFETYLNQSASELKRLGKKERGEKVRPTSDTKTITEDLREAEKCLRHAFTQERLSHYRTLLADFEKTGPAKAAEGEDEDEQGKDDLEPVAV